MVFYLTTQQYGLVAHLYAYFILLSPKVDAAGGAVFDIQIISTVPDRLDGWEETFDVPTQYSESSMLAISKGELTSSARREIVQSVASKMLNNCKYPTTDQIDVVASKIVEKIKGSRDYLGTGHVRSSMTSSR